MDLFKGIVEQRQDVLNHLYKSLFPIVKKLIFKQGGDYDTANDIFQETIILLYRKAKAGKLSEKMMVESYIVGMCKIIWLQHYEKETQNNWPIRQTGNRRQFRIQTKSRRRPT